MLRLTLRSGREGRLLARVVERDGVLFVLDFGDPELMADASRRVLHGGFSVEWQGSIENAIPNHPAMLRQLALHYAEMGMLVFVDEPGFVRTAPLRVARAVPPMDGLLPLPISDGPPTLLPDEIPDYDCNTELRSLRDLQELQDRIDSTRNTGPQMPYAEVQVEDEEFPTDEVTHLRPSARSRE